MSRQDDAVDTSSSEEISLGKRKKAHAPAPPKKAITVPKAKDDGKASQMKAAVAHGTRTKSKGTAERPSTGEKEGNEVLGQLLWFPASFEALQNSGVYFVFDD